MNFCSWEDASEGVFRIVESEKLAKLWGEKKNNQKMTYEKLSRAMRYSFLLIQNSPHYFRLFICLKKKVRNFRIRTKNGNFSKLDNHPNDL